MNILCRNRTFTWHLKNTKFTTFTGVDDTSKIYFLTENGGGFFDVTFGNGVHGKSLSPLDTVRLDYLTTAGAPANGATSFTYASGSNSVITGTGTPVLVVKSQGGEERETLSSIKYNAPLTFVSPKFGISLSCPPQTATSFTLLIFCLMRVL